MIGLIAIASLGAVGLARIKKQKSAENKSCRPVQPVIKATLILLISFALPYALYFAWRWHYFGQLLPNTYYCKASAAGNPWALLSQYWSDSIYLVLLALLFPWRKLDIRASTLMAVVFAYIAMLYGADTIIAYKMRLGMAPFAILCVLASVSLLCWTEHFLPNIRRRLPAALFLTVLLTWQGALSYKQIRLRGFSTSDAQRTAMRASLGRWLDPKVGPDDWVLLGDVGVIPYHTNASIADTFCLNSWRFTSDKIAKDNTRYIEWVLADLKPRVIVFHSASGEQIIPRPEYNFYPTLAADPRLKRDYALEKVFGVAGDDFYYWVLVRKKTLKSDKLP